MANFHAEPQRMRRSAQNMATIRRYIQLIREDVLRLMNQDCLGISDYDAVRKRLLDALSRAETAEESLHALSQALNEITALYENAEERAAGNSKSVKSVLEAVGNAVAKIRGDVRRMSGAAGMDPAALYSDDPVNLSNGNYVYEKTFFHFETPVSMNLRIFYNARGSFGGALGDGWSHCFERRLQRSEGQAQILNEDGSVQVFREADGRFSAASGSVGELSMDGGDFRYLDEERTAYRFAPDGRFLSACDKNGWRVEALYENERLSEVRCTDRIALRFSYHEDGRLSEVRDHSGRTVAFLYADGFLTGVKDCGGFVTSYAYDDAGRLSRITAPSGDLSVENAYDERGRAVRQTFADGGEVAYRYEDEKRAVVMRRQNGSEVAYYHDALFRNTRTVYSDGEETVAYNERNQRVSFTDKLGRVSRYQYDAAGRLQTFVNALGNRLSFAYNGDGQLTQTALDGETLDRAEYDGRGRQILHRNPEGGEVRFRYDAMGRVTAVVHEDGSETRLSYDVLGNVERVEEPGSGTVHYEYDACRRVTRTTDALGHETRYEYDERDLLTKVVNAEGNERVYEYDRRENVTRVTDFNGAVTTIDYNAMNRPVCVTDPDGHKTRFEYDLMSNPVRRITDDGAAFEYAYDDESRLVRVRRPMGGVETAEYDAVGNLIRRRDADGGEYRIEYDALNRPVCVTDPVGATRRASYDALGNVTAISYGDGTEERFAYDRMGRCLSHTDQSGYCRRFRYDALGNLLEIRDDTGVLAEYFYGPGGQLLREKSVSGASLSYSYDALGNVTRLEDSARGVWNYAYDSLGQLVRAEHEGVGVERYAYDALGNLTEVTDALGNRTAFQYTPAGALEKVTDAAGAETAYRYDPLYRLTEIRQPERDPAAAARVTAYERDLDGNVISVRDALGNRTRYAYDLCGRVTMREDADGNVLECAYYPDGMERALSFGDGRRIQYQYDALKRLSRVEDWLGVTRIRRDAAGRVTERLDPDGGRTAYGWNARGQRVSLRYPNGDAVSYEYDDASRLSRCVSGAYDVRYAYRDNGQLRERTFSGSLRARYAFDAAGRISELTRSDGESFLERYAYAYDACSRKTSVSFLQAGQEEIRSEFRYDPLGRLTEVLRDGASAETYEYDRFGNRLRMTRNGERVDYRYDALNRLEWSRSPTQERVWTYDRRGNVTSESVNGVARLNLTFDALNRLSHAASEWGEADYVYDGLAQLRAVRTRPRNAAPAEERLFFDASGEDNRLLASRRNGAWKTVVWDSEAILSVGADGASVFLNDERMSNGGLYASGRATRYAYSPFGVPAPGSPVPDTLAFTGFRYDPVTGFYDAGWRQYDPRNGRFISQDPVSGELDRPATLNPYPYCLSDPMNYRDPTGMILAWLAGGIVGSIANVTVKFAGDVVNSFRKGKVTFSSWESYVGSAAGGFVQGSVFTVAGPTAAGAAGAATETLVTNGLSMATGREGFRKEDGYNVGKLFTDTAGSAAVGGVSGYSFQWAAKYVKIPGITAGKGSYISVWKQVTTKANRGIIGNIATKTLMKGLVSYGFIRAVDTFLVKGKEAVGDAVKEKGKAWLHNLMEKIKNRAGSGANDGRDLPDGARQMIYGYGAATCPMT